MSAEMMCYNGLLLAWLDVQKGVKRRQGNERLKRHFVSNLLLRRLEAHGLKGLIM